MLIKKNNFVITAANNLKKTLPKKTKINLKKLSIIKI